MKEEVNWSVLYERIADQIPPIDDGVLQRAIDKINGEQCSCGLATVKVLLAEINNQLTHNKG